MLMVSLNIVIIKRGAMENTTKTNNVISFKYPMYTEYRSVTARMDSYLHYEWPIGLRQTPNSLAEAGFFYFGKSDKVVCYHCGGGLSRWDREDNPWKEHARNFPTCIHLMMQKTAEFINNAQIIYIPTPTYLQTNTNNLLHDNYDTTSKRPEAGSSMVNNLSNGIQIIEKLINKEVRKEKKKKENHKCKSTENLQDGRKCKICMDKDIKIVFLNCGHVCACSMCASSCVACPFCRAEIDKFVKMYFS